jgi:C-terminal processing protease CtpA/Prc
MAFRSAHATVIGRTTAGADGDVSQFSLPKGLRTMIGGIGVFYPDKKPTQRVGIIPDIEVKPTIAGIRDGRERTARSRDAADSGSSMSPASSQMAQA